jgi:ssDNA-binding Zn-finger/Zn-ribbon topoisomerase 1
MARVCLKCNYERTPNELAPETECPQCGAIYAKIEKALRPPEAATPGVASQTPESSE